MSDTINQDDAPDPKEFSDWLAWALTNERDDERISDTRQKELQL